jgi:hypothetical protein
VVRSPDWDNGAVANAGAATWGNGATGVTGAVSPTNSLVGSQTGDQVGRFGVTALTNGNYVVVSVDWDNGAVANVGAATWGNGATGIVGPVSPANSLVGSQANDNVGFDGVRPLSNGNYLVISKSWNNGAAVDAGAATWGNGATGITGIVSPTNSLVGSQTGDRVGGVIALTNGNYVVTNSGWDNGALVNAGAATWGNGATGIVGPVSPANSLVGSQTGNLVGNDVTALTNGNYVVVSSLWDNGVVANVGAVTWGNGATGLIGEVSPTNSLVGSQTSDEVGLGGVTALANGNYVVASRLWANGVVVDAGAATWGDGRRGVRGVVSPTNSLVGSTASDSVSIVTALTNGNYVVHSSNWDNGSIVDAGAVTWGDGRRGVRGVVGPANSVVGSQANDQVGREGITILTNGNYLVNSPEWDNSGIVDAGAVTFGDGGRGARGVVSAANSLVGGTAGDTVANTIVNTRPVVALNDGNYLVHSISWDNPVPLRANSGAVTLGDGAAGTVGLVNRAHSVLGVTTGFGSTLEFTHNPATGQLIVGQSSANLVTLLGNYFDRTLARSGERAPGAVDVFTAKPGAVAVNEPGVALFDALLTGSGASGGRNRALFGRPPGGTPELVLQSGDKVSALGGGLPADAQATAFFSPLMQKFGRGLFQSTVKGSGINGLNNRLLLADSGSAVWLVRRTGTPVTELGGAQIRSFREVVQSPNRDQIVLSYQLQGSAVSGSNDTGLLTLRHDGSVIGNSFLIREGQPAIGGGTFGQFTGQASLPFIGDELHFTALVNNGTVKTALFEMEEDGSDQALVAATGNVATGAEPGVFSSFPALSSQLTQAVFKGLMKGVPASANEGLWRADELLLREGDGITSLPGVAVSGILRFWPVSFDRVVLQVVLRGTGVNATNNQALVLRQANGQHQVLVRTGDSPAGIGSATLRSIVAVDVNPTSGTYALLTTLTGAPGSSNLALWAGNTTLGNDNSQQALRLPILQLRKGDIYGTLRQSLGVVRSLSLKPAVDRSGAGGRGLAQAVGFDGDVAIYITADRGVTELVLLPPVQPVPVF